MHGAKIHIFSKMAKKRVGKNWKEQKIYLFLHPINNYIRYKHDAFFTENTVHANGSVY